MNNFMKNLTRILSLILLTALVFHVSATNDFAEAKKIKLSLALESGDKTSQAGQNMQLWSKLIKERSDGRIRVNVFYQGELGGQQELFDQLVKGNIDMMLTWPQTSYDKSLGINHIPYLVLDWEDALVSFGADGWLKKLIDPVFGKMGLKYFGPYPEGFGGIATKKRYATSNEAAQGLKVRSQPIFPLPQTIKAMGFQPVPIDWNEVYTSIQTGVVDGDSSNVIYWDYEYFRDQLDYFVHSGHNFSSYALLMNSGSWDMLSAEDQKIIEDAAQEVIKKQFVEAKAVDEKWIKAAQEAGIEYIVPTSEEKAAWVSHVRAEVWPEIEKELGKEVMDAVRANATVPN